MVLDAKEHDFLKAEIDVYVFQISGAGQHAVQVFGEKDGNSVASDIKRQLNFLQALKQHGFTQSFLLLAQETPIDETELKLLLPDKLVWQELQPTSQDINGPWKCAVLPI